MSKGDKQVVYGFFIAMIIMSLVRCGTITI